MNIDTLNDPTDGIFDQTDPKQILAEFGRYDATYIKAKINSTSKDSERKWVRKASFMQLGYSLSSYLDDYKNTLTDEQIAAIENFMSFAFSKEFIQQEMTTKDDIEKAINVLDILGFDVSKQREELGSWD